MNYSKIPWTEWQMNPPDLEKFEWDVADTKLLINSEGCGVSGTEMSYET